MAPKEYYLVAYSVDSASLGEPVWKQPPKTSEQKGDWKDLEQRSRLSVTKLVVWWLLPHDYLKIFSFPNLCVI